MSIQRWLAASVVPVGGLAAAAIALAAAPSNDDREDAATVPIPSTVSGTTAEATREQNEPGCGSGASVWYRVDVPARGEVNVSLAAQGELDATIDVLQRQRSQLSSVGCRATDAEGRTDVTFRAEAGSSYLIQVAERSGSAPGGFDMTVQFEAPTPRAPGARLSRRGASGRVHPVLRPAAAYSTVFRDGRPYRLNLHSGARSGCQRLQVFEPGTDDFDSETPKFEMNCSNPYRVFTPGPGDGGRYSLVVRAADEDRGSQPFRLQSAPAQRDDVAPGRFMRNYARVRGSVSARGVDVVDLYRFDVVRRSDLDLVLDTSGGLDLQLMRESGGRLKCACSGTGGRLRARLGRGRYYAAVRARPGERGRYTLRRVSRTITRSSIAIDGRRRGKVRPGRTVPISVKVRPAVSGPVTIIVYRFDPIEGWRYAQRFRRDSRTGQVTAPLRLREPGRWRARAVFHGTRVASESRTGYAFVTAEAPLMQRR